MKDELFSADRSLTLLIRMSTTPTEATLTVWAIIALLLVLAAIAFGGPS